MVDFSHWWSFIGKGLLLQPAQQACLLQTDPSAQLDLLIFWMLAVLWGSICLVSRIQRILALCSPAGTWLPDTLKLFTNDAIFLGRFWTPPPPIVMLNKFWLTSVAPHIMKIIFYLTTPPSPPRHKKSLLPPPPITIQKNPTIGLEIIKKQTCLLQGDFFLSDPKTPLFIAQGTFSKKIPL